MNQLCFFWIGAIRRAAVFLSILAVTGCFSPLPVEEETGSRRSSSVRPVTDRTNGSEAAVPEPHGTPAAGAAEDSTNESPTGPLERYPIDLPSALRLARAQNYQIALARERITEALARLEQTQILLLPSLTIGASYHQHEGRIQETNGNILEVSRNSGYAGLGAGAVGAGGVQAPGQGRRLSWPARRGRFWPDATPSPSRICGTSPSRCSAIAS